jgi:nucleoside-diphosphate-sugar epimerase
MNILIIGNLGYVGPVVVEHLSKLNKEYDLYGYDLGLFSGNETTRNSMLPETKLKAQFYGDVRDFDETILKGMDVVVYLAAISNDPMGNVFEKPTFEINQNCAVKIAKASKSAGVKKFVFASSCSVYGLADNNARDENSEVNPLTAYAKSKVNTEVDLKPLADNDLTITCLRFATACGFSSRLRLDLVLNDFVASAIATKKIEILSDGSPWRPLIDVKDMAKAIEWAMTRTADPVHLVVNAGSNEWNFQVLDLAKAVKKVLPEVEINVNPKGQPDNRSYKVDFSLYKKLAKGFYPSDGIEKTINELVNGLRSINFNDSDFRNSHLIRLKTLNALLNKEVLDQQLHIV